MDTDRTIARLAFAERLPVGVIQACLSNRNEVVPAFIDLLQRCGNNTPVSHEEERAIFLIVHILGELGEKEAFQPLMNFLAGDQERVNRVIGDAVTENLPKILISTFDGSTRRLYDVMNDAEVDEFVRDAVFRAWTYFVGMGEIDRDEARRYPRERLRDLAADQEQLCVGLVGRCCCPPRLRRHAGPGQANLRGRARPG